MKRRQLQKELRVKLCKARLGADGAGHRVRRGAQSQTMPRPPCPSSYDQRCQWSGVRQQQLIQVARGPINTVLHKTRFKASIQSTKESAKMSRSEDTLAKTRETRPRLD